MGMFGGGGSDNGNDLANEQIRQNQAELEEKRQNLYQERLDIIKGQGGTSWAPDTSSGSVNPKPKMPMGGFGL